MLQWFTITFTVITFTIYLQNVESCNEAICGSIVSKCLLTQSCKCTMKDCTCCKECANCLNYLYSECCSCVDLCPKQNDTGSALSKKSHVEDFKENVPQLFAALTNGEDADNRWKSITFPVDFDNLIFAPKKEIKLHLQSVEQEVVPVKPNVTTLNCTVAFMTQCMSWPKCRSSCQSMGATSYRWFHDGCCECVGDTCINYGINESRCKCTLHDEAEESVDLDDYGDSDDYSLNGSDDEEEDDVL